MYDVVICLHMSVTIRTLKDTICDILLIIYMQKHPILDRIGKNRELTTSGIISQEFSACKMYCKRSFTGLLMYNNIDYLVIGRNVEDLRSAVRTLVMRRSVLSQILT